MAAYAGAGCDELAKPVSHLSLEASAWTYQLFQTFIPMA